jgi:hypothetical protein
VTSAEAKSRVILFTIDQKTKNSCEGRCCRHIAGASEAEALVGVEPTMADLQSGRKTQKRRVKQMLPQHGGVLAGVTRWHIPQRPRPLKS